MTYEDVCKYVFEKELLDWSLCKSRKRDRNLKEARQIAIYCGNFINSATTWSALGEPFARDHSTAMHSVHTIQNLMCTEPALRQKILLYLDEIKTKSQADKLKEAKLTYQNEAGMKKLMEAIDKMELIAMIYCDLMDKKIVANE